MRIAIVGSGIAGLGAALLLQRQGHDTTLFEGHGTLGGHTATVDVTLDGITFPVDTGFLVYNDRTYPKLIALFEELGVASVASEMSFSCRIDAVALEWAGTNVAALFAQPRNALRPAFWRMLADMLRFNRSMTALLARDRVFTLTLGEYLDTQGYSAAFRDWYLLPMAGAIWSAGQNDILKFPLPTFARFCHNHGLLQVFDRPQWRTVLGGARTYVANIAARLPDVRVATPVRRVTRIVNGVLIDSARKDAERFDAVVLACHSDQTLALLTDATAQERAALAAVRYQKNRVVLHTDPALLPRRKRAWSAWNYLACDDADGTRPVAVSYLINKLQPLPTNKPVVVTLNPPFEPRTAYRIAEFEYAHPLLDQHALDAQQTIARMQGERHTYFAGAWLGYGFHEDGLRSAYAIADAIGKTDAHSPLAARTERAAA